MSAPFRAADEAARLPSPMGATLAAIAHHHRAVQGLIDDIERERRSGADMTAIDSRLGHAHDFASSNARRLNALRTGDLEAVRLDDLEFLKRFAPVPLGPARRAAE